MRSQERIRGLLRSPKLAWDCVLRGRYHFVYDQMPFALSGMSVKRRLNLFKAGFNLVHRRSNPWSMPLHLQMELVNYCNLSCPVCPTGIGALKRKPMAMDVGLLERVMGQAGPCLLTVSLWGWGEPLLHPELQNILSAVRKHDVAVLLSTNGSHLNDDRIVEALTREPPTHLIVSIDGLSDETNVQYRVGARLGPILSGVRKIAELKRRRNQQLPLLHMRFMVMKHNQHELRRVRDFAERNHFDLLSRSFAFLWLGDRRDKLCAATALQDPLRGLTRVVEFPMPHRVLVGRIEDRLLEESIIHAQVFSSRTVLQWMARLARDVL